MNSSLICGDKLAAVSIANCVDRVRGHQDRHRMLMLHRTVRENFGLPHFHHQMVFLK
jgi:hypothetical protein